jgi:hypothetical protein
MKNSPQNEIDERPRFAKRKSSLDFPLTELPSLFPDPLNLFDLTGGYKVRFRKGIKKMTLFRFLLAKLLYEEKGGLHLDEFIILFELYYYFSEFKDPSFLEKYSEWFYQTELFFKDLAEEKEFPIIMEESNSDKLIPKLQPILPSKLAYFGLKGQRNLSNSFSIILNRTLVPKSVKNKRFIGVGYKDKGSRKDKAVDGSPSWQEVASSFVEEEILPKSSPVKRE